MKRITQLILPYILLLSTVACQEENQIPFAKSEKSGIENIVIIVIDGPRHSETWGDATRQHIPRQDALSQQGLLFTNFKNDGITFTLSGHTAITTGVYENVINNGDELPGNPSIFQRFLKAKQASPEKALIVTSKSKLNALRDTKDLNWNGSYLPTIDVADRADQLTYEESIGLLNEHTPNLSMIHFRGPDKKGHGADWNGYLEKIEETDQYVGELWDFIQGHAHYRDKTLLLITTDHGRHLDGIGSGFVGHGDGCPGCRHIYLLAIGPGVPQGEQVSLHYNQTDIAPTVAHVLGFPWQGDGKSIYEIVN